MTDTAFQALTAYINSTASEDEALNHARHEAAEYNIPVPNAVIGELLSALATNKTSAIVVTPAAAVTGLYILPSLDEKAILTCIDPDSEHRRCAEKAFKEAGYKSSRFRFLVTNPLEVMGRLADSSYELIVADVAPLDVNTFIDAAWPLLEPNGVLVLPELLLDGTIADTSRRDRETVAVRDAEAKLTGLEDAVVSRLPLGSGLVLAVKKTQGPDLAEH